VIARLFSVPSLPFPSFVMGTFNLEDQLAFYGAFHHNKLNQLIHIIFVPAIVWSALVFLVLLTPGANHSIVELGSKSLIGQVLPAHGVNLSLLMYAVYAIYYLTLDFWPALAYDVFLFFLYVTANWTAHSTPNALYIALVVHALSWYMQIHPGHLVLEKRRPALLQSFFQSLVLAPIFTFFEVLFYCGLKQDLFRKVQKRVLANIRQFKQGVPADKQTF